MLTWTTTPGSPGRLTFREMPEPAPLPHEVLVRVEAFATSLFPGTEPNLHVEIGYLAADRSLDVGDISVAPWSELATWIDAGARRRSGRVVFRVDHGGAAR